MARRYVLIGETYPITLGWSEVCLHLRVADKTMRVQVTTDGARILWPDGGYSVVTHGEAGIYTDYDNRSESRHHVDSALHRAMRKCATMGCTNAASRRISYLAIPTDGASLVTDDVCAACATDYVARPALGAAEVPMPMEVTS